MPYGGTLYMRIRGASLFTDPGKPPLLFYRPEIPGKKYYRNHYVYNIQAEGPDKFLFREYPFFYYAPHSFKDMAGWNISGYCLHRPRHNAYGIKHRRHGLE